MMLNEKFTNIDMTKFNNCITSYDDLVTSRAQTRAGFIEAALEKNRKSKPYIEEAKTLKQLASSAPNASALLSIFAIRNGLLTASGLSDKSLKYFTEEDKTEAIKTLIEKFLEPSGKDFIDELVYRFLLIRGDSLGGSMRNFVGEVAEMKLVRKLLSVLSMYGAKCRVLSKKNKKNKKNNLWQDMDYEQDYELADSIAAISWELNGNQRVIFFNAKITLVGNNIDVCVFNGNEIDYNGGAIVSNDAKALMFGELKGGIDPAGADEHWKTGNTALGRIRSAFEAKNHPIYTSFVGAAIEKKMATEIWAQLVAGTLSNAANMTDDKQLTNYCEWIVKL